MLPILQLCRYNHRNPVAAGIVKRPEEYEWSSYRAYVSGINVPSWLTWNELPNYFPGPNPLTAMREFVEKSTNQEPDNIKFEKFLKASCDNSAGISNRCISHPQDQGMLQKLSIKPESLKEVTKAVSIYYKVAEENIFECQPGKKNDPRDVAIYLARKELGIGTREIATKFSISRNSASSVLSKIRTNIQKMDSIAEDIRTLKSAIQRIGTPQ